MAAGQRGRGVSRQGSPPTSNRCRVRLKTCYMGDPMQCNARVILSLIDTSRAGTTTLGMHLCSCELFGMQGCRPQDVMMVKSDWPVCVSPQKAALDPRALTGLGAGRGRRFVQGPHGDPETRPEGP